MTQLVTRLDDALLAELDALVADGVAPNRSETVRLALRRLVDAHARGRVGERIAEGYRRRPQTHAELAGIAQATRALVAEEPW